MIPNDISYLCAIGLALAVCVLAIIDAGRAPGWRRFYRWLQMTACFYFALIYLLALLYLKGIDLPEDMIGYLKEGAFSRWGIIFILLATATELLFYIFGKRYARPDI